MGSGARPHESQTNILAERISSKEEAGDFFFEIVPAGDGETSFSVL